jgi:hypothetical protein
MRRNLVGVLLLLALFGGACEQTDSDVDAAATASPLEEGTFLLTGSVVDAKAGVVPEGGIPDEETIDVDGERGGIAVLPSRLGEVQGVEDCETVQDAYVVYYTSGTEFVPDDVLDVRGFPDNLENEPATVTGDVRRADEPVDATPASPGAVETVETGCVLVADRVELEDATASPVARDDATGGEPVAAASPDATASPQATEIVIFDDPSFPKHEDTDPIFEGTPSPDPCEGAKACREKREEEEQEADEESPSP